MRYKRKKENDMGAVLSLQQHIDKKDKQLYPYSVANMIFDQDYRKKTYEHYNNQYQETKEEKEIFNMWTKRRKEKDK